MARQIYQAIVDGILVGGVYALMAVGLTLIFGVLDIINIAQGVLVILGAYLSSASPSSGRSSGGCAAGSERR
jgi:branched-chain amino acid transport system permease protein